MRRTHSPGRPLLCAVLLAALAALAAVGPPDARAHDPGTTPVFTSPLEVTNPLHPVVPGAVKVYAGRGGGAPVTIVETHGDATRVFAWDGGTVACRTVVRLEFVRGVPDARETSWFAQADDGSVWCFGEEDDRDLVDDADEDAGEPGGWIVGARSPEDLPTLLEAASPTLVMPASPRRGDAWAPEELPPLLLKRSRALTVDAVVRAAGARRVGCLRVRESDLADGGDAEVRTYAPGIGLVGTRERGEWVRLTASTLAPSRTR